ncbi:The GLUG motif protein [compost metagenome]
MKKSSSQYLSIFFLLLCGFVSNAQTYSGGGGTILNPHFIANKADLRYLSEHPGDWNKHFKQIADIHFVSSDFQSGGNFYNGGQGFNPIGNDATPFSGNYDGNGHVIDSLYINRPAQDYVGFFGKKVWSTTSGLGLTNVSMTGHSFNGVLAGYAEGTIVDCYATGNITGTLTNNVSKYHYYTGGLIGYYSDGMISQCYSETHVDGYLVGGLIAYINNGNIRNSYATGNVNGNNSSYSGGLIGFIGLFSTATVTDCYASGEVSGNAYVGGLIGHSNGTISKCFATGTVNGNFDGGGLIGFNYSGSTTRNCYATGNVNGNMFLGGLTGYNLGNVQNCHAVGTVTSITSNDTTVGGLSGGNQGNFEHCFWDIQTSGHTSSFGGTGLMTSAMKNTWSFTSATWDLVLETANGTDDIWKMGECSFDYPVFSWQTVVPHPGSDSDVFSCKPFLWEQNGITYAVSGSYSDTVQNTTGCDSIVRLNLAIGVSSATIAVNACERYTWTQNGTTYTTSGLYTDTLLNVAGCDSIVILDLTINELPSATATDNGDATLTASSGASYQWINCGTNTLIAGATAQTFTASANGVYAVIVTNAQNCSDTSNCVAINNLGLDENSSLFGVTLTPNPTPNEATITFTGVNEASVVIYDAQGKMVMSLDRIQSGEVLSLEPFERGIYLIHITTNSGKHTRRLVKQ